MLNSVAVRFEPSLLFCPPKTKMKLLSLFQIVWNQLSFSEGCFSLEKELCLQEFEESWAVLSADGLTYIVWYMQFLFSKGSS